MSPVSENGALLLGNADRGTTTQLMNMYTATPYNMPQATARFLKKANLRLAA